MRGQRKRTNTSTDGFALGTALGDAVGTQDGMAVGTAEGTADGSKDGFPLGTADGCFLCRGVVLRWY